MRGVAFQVVHHLRARRVARIAARHRQAGQAGVVAIGVQVQAVVVAAPDRADRVALFQDGGLDAVLAERRRAGQAGGAGADDEDFCRGWAHGSSTAERCAVWRAFCARQGLRSAHSVRCRLPVRQGSAVSVSL